MKIIQTFDLSDELTTLLIDTRMVWKVKEDGVTMFANHFGKELCIEVSVEPNKCLYNPYISYANNLYCLPSNNAISVVAGFIMSFIDGYEACIADSRD